MSDVIFHCDVHVGAENKSTWALKTKPRDGVWSSSSAFIGHIQQFEYSAKGGVRARKRERKRDREKEKEGEREREREREKGEKETERRK